MNDGSFVYKRTDDNFILYSKGKNNIDEDGQVKIAKPDGSRTDDFIFWPPKTCNDQEESKNDEQG